MKLTIVLATPHTMSHRTAEETLALGYLASILRDSGHSVSLLDGWLRGINAHDITEHIRVIDPDVICMSCYRSNLEQAKEILCLVPPNIPTICGGFGPSFNDSDFLDAGFTIAVRGEAEGVIARLVEVVCAGGDLHTIPGITFRENGSIVRTKQTEPVRDLDNIPFPARDEIQFTIANKNPVHVCTSRGCRAHCKFCSVFAFALEGSKEERWRARSIHNTVNELDHLHRGFGVTHFKFVDDSFIEPPRDEQWAAEFADAVLRLKIPIKFRTQVRADRLNDQIVRHLKRAGWFATSVGIESGSPSALKRMGKTATAEDNCRALALLHEHSIYVQMGMILFDDGTTLEELEENYKFLAQHDWVITKGVFTEMFAAEGTPFTRRITQRGRFQQVRLLQNYRYEIADPQARRVHAMLKAWHKSHSVLFDWAVDSIAAPKVLPDEGYRSIHAICQELVHSGIAVFRRVLDHVMRAPPETDGESITAIVAEHTHFYACLWSKVQRHYDHYGLAYDGIPNPFLS